ncbi:MAG: hypothetical protein M3120_02855, partial [Pseudomonadota bacterium]|nr:hypothetical protein [Pseudomonadota bacterium]
IMSPGKRMPDSPQLAEDQSRHIGDIGGNHASGDGATRKQRPRSRGHNTSRSSKTVSALNEQAGWITI